MRLVQISVPAEQQESYLEVLRELQLGYTITAGAGEQQGRVVINFVVPADAVEHVFTNLEAAGFDKETYTVSIDAEFANFEHVDEVQNRWGKTPNRLAPAALRSKAKDLRRNTRSYVWMMILSAIVATAGLLLGSPAVVVGSMVIAPIVSPALTASVGAVRNDRDMFIQSINMQALGLGIAIVTATVFSLVIRQIDVVPGTLAIEQMELVALRLSPSILSLAVGLAAGAAGAYGLATKGSATIVGVMIAAALIPTAAAVGIGLAWGNFVLTLGALLLLILSVIAVNIGGTGMLFYLAYRPDEADQGFFSFDTRAQALSVAVTLFLVVVVVAVSGFAFVQQSSFERSVNDAVTDVLDEEYDDLRVMSIEQSVPFVCNETGITVTLARTSNETHRGLPDELAEQISSRTDEKVTVQVRYVDFERSATTANGLTGRDGVLIPDSE